MCKNRQNFPHTVSVDYAQVNIMIRIFILDDNNQIHLAKLFTSKVTTLPFRLFSPNEPPPQQFLGSNPLIRI